MKDMLKVKELQEKLGISRQTIYRLVEEGLPHEIVGVRTKIFDLDTVKRFMESRRSGIEELKPGEVINNQRLAEIYKCSTQGGMRRSHTTNTLVLVSDHSNANNVYDDQWIGDRLHYTGMGLKGDQDIDFAQNRTLKESNTNGTVNHLFEVFNEGEYTYRGIVKLVDEPYQTEESGRIVWKFPLEIIAGEKNIDRDIIKELEHKKAQFIKKLDINILKEKAIQERENVSSRITKGVMYERNMYVSEYVKRRANGKCQLCGSDAPFNDKDGKPYLESHHVEWLSRGGKDNIFNCCAVCPNCHKRLHILDDENDVRKLNKLLEKYKEEI